MIKTVISSSSRPVWITEQPGKGWKLAAEGAPSAREVAFDVRIEYDGNGGLLVVKAVDGSVQADEYLEQTTLKEAQQIAEAEYGVEQWRDRA